MKPSPLQLAAMFLVALGVGGASFAAEGDPDPMKPSFPPRSELLRTLRQGHPRLMATAADFDELKARVAKDPTLTKWLAALRREADKMLKAPPEEHRVENGWVMLNTCHRVLDRVETLSMVYRLTGERAYADRAWRELEAAAAFKDWNPQHFLDTATLSHAFGIGYDWLYDVWTDEQRAILRRALIDKGLRPGLDCYEGHGLINWWPKCGHNWNQVCNGGLTIGALAIADAEPAVAAEVLDRALHSLTVAMRQYAPDGGWAEGPGYWHFGTRYNCYMLAVLETALGSDFGLGRLPGFAETGFFPIYMTGPLGRTFNFADAKDHGIRAAQMFYLARRFSHPELVAWQLDRAAATPLDLLWYRPAEGAGRPADLPLDKLWRKTEVATMRTAWDDPQAWFVGLKAGDNSVNHSHLDLGTFVLDALGQRWAVDLGYDDYSLPDYFGKQRYDYYRLRAEGHNTLVINPDDKPDQSPEAMTKIAAFKSGPQGCFAVADLSAAYAARGARSVRRGIALQRAGGVRVQDEIELASPGTVWWFMHTEAQVTLGDDPRTATLQMGDRKLRARIITPAEARWRVRDARPLPSSPDHEKQDRNSGTRKLAICLEKVAALRLVVVLEPADAEAQPVEPKPLADW